MLDETLAKLETTIRQSDAIQAEKKTELVQLLSTLRAEVAALAQTHAEHAASVIEFAERSAQEAIRQPRDAQSVTAATQGLAASVAELEASHPQLVQIVNAISVQLSNIGI